MVAQSPKVADKVEIHEVSEGHQYISREILQQYKVLRRIKQNLEMSWRMVAERKACREVEIEGLKNDLHVLENGVAFVQTPSLRGVRRHA